MARILGIEIDGDVLRGALVQTSLRSFEVLAIDEVRILAHGPNGAGAAALNPETAEGPLPVPDSLSREPVPGSLSSGPASSPAWTYDDDVTPGDAEDDEDDDGHRLSRPSLAELPPEALSLRHALKMMLARMHPAPDRVVAAFPGAQASFRHVELPAVAARRVADVLPFELDGSVPYDIEDMVISHQELRRNRSEVQVLAVAVPKALVAAYLAPFRELPIVFRELSVGALALEGAVRLEPALLTSTVASSDPSEAETGSLSDEDALPGAHVVIYEGAARIEIALMVEGICVLARTVTLSEALQTARRESREAIPEALLQPVSSELRRTLLAHRSQGTHPIRSFRICGTPTLLLNMRDVLAEVSGCDVSLMELQASERVDASMLMRGAYAVSLAAASTLKRKRLNLQQGEFASRLQLAKAKRYTRSAAMLAGLLLVSWTFSMYARWTVLDAENERLTAELRAQSALLWGKEMDQVDIVKKRMEAKISTGPLPEYDAFSVLRDISDSIAPDIIHDTRRLRISAGSDKSEGSFEIDGTIESIAQRDQISEALEALVCFQDIQRGKTTPFANGERLNYQISAKILCEGPKQNEANKDNASTASSQGKEQS